MEQREFALRWFLKECSLKYNDLSINLTPFETDDRGNKNEQIFKYAICFDKRNPALERFVGPDSYFHSFEDIRDKIIAAGNLPPTVNKIGWFHTHVPEESISVLLKKISDENKHLFDSIQVDSKDERFNHTLPKEMRYRFLIDTCENSSSSHLKLLLFSKRPLLLIDRNYIEYYHNELKPFVHYIPVNMDLSDLLEKTQWMIDHYEESLEIAAAAFEFATTHFTKDKIIDRVYYVHKNILNAKAQISNNYTEVIKNAFSNANKSISNLTADHGPEKHMLNNLCFISPRLLELGTWETALISSAMYQNSGSYICINTPPKYEMSVREFFDTVSTSKGTNNPIFHEGNYFDVHTTSMEKSNILVYTGKHTLKSTYSIMKHFILAMDDIFIIVLNDWNCRHTRAGFQDALQELSLRINFDAVNMNWKTGIYVAVLERQ